MYGTIFVGQNLIWLGESHRGDVGEGGRRSHMKIIIAKVQHLNESHTV